MADQKTDQNRDQQRQADGQQKPIERDNRQGANPDKRFDQNRDKQAQQGEQRAPGADPSRR